MRAKVNRIEKLASFNIFDLVTENITLSNGVETDIHILRHPGAAAILPLTANGGVILIQQYRHAVGEAIWEIPAGTFDADETPLDCARRELREETGYRAAQWQKLGEITPVPAWSDERIHVYLATELQLSKPNLEKDELLQTHEVAWPEAINMIQRGQIQDAKTICAFFWAVGRSACSIGA